MAGLIGSTKTFVFKLVDSSEKTGEAMGKAENVGEVNTQVHLLGTNKQELQTVMWKSITQIAETTVQVIDYSIGKNLELTENYIGQQEVSNLKSQMDKVTGFASSIASGAMKGAAAGPIGAVIGAVTGAIDWGVGQAISYNKELSNYYRQLNSANAQTQWNSVRMGLIDGGRGTEN